MTFSMRTTSSHARRQGQTNSTTAEWSMPGAIINVTPEKATRCPGLEPYDERLSRTVFRGPGGLAAPRLPDHFRAGEFDRQELRRRLVPLQARLGRLLRRGQKNADPKAAGLCRELRKGWPARWTFARVEGVEPTNNGAERALRPAVLWRKGSFGSDSKAGSRFAERLLTVVATCRQQGRPLLRVLLALSSACLPASGQADTTSLAAASVEQVVRLPSVEPTTIDPGLANDVISTEVIEQLFEGLVAIDDNGNIYGVEAQE